MAETLQVARTSYSTIWGKSFPSKGSSKCKGTEVTPGVFKDDKEPAVAEAVREGGRGRRGVERDAGQVGGRCRDWPLPRVSWDPLEGFEQVLTDCSRLTLVAMLCFGQGGYAIKNSNGRWVDILLSVNCHNI